MEKTILEDESSQIEYKKAIPTKDKTWLKTIVSFSNTNGGNLIVGVIDNTLEIIGITEDRSVIEQRIIETISSNITPKPIIDISFRSIDNKDIIYIYVAKGNETPYFLIKEGVNEGCYVRYGSTDRLATESERLELIMMKKNLHFSNELYENQGKYEIVNNSEVSEFLEVLNSQIKTNKLINKEKLLEWEILRKLNQNIYKTNGYKMLTNNPFSHNYIKIGIFEGLTKSVLKEEIIINGNIIEQYQNTLIKVLEILNDGFTFKFKREKKFKVPETTVREILANAIIHRNYMEKHPVRISVFTDRIEFFSPGSLYDGLQLEEALAGISKIRNLNIAEIFYHLGIIEKWGSGIIRANEELASNSMKPILFELSGHGLNAIIYFDEVETTPLNDLNLNNYILIKKSFTRRELETDLDITEHQARYYIEKWLKDNLIIREGSSKRSIYIVVNSR